MGGIPVVGSLVGTRDLLPSRQTRVSNCGTADRSIAIGQSQARGAPALSGRWKSGASKPRNVEAMVTTTPARPGEYHPSVLIGVVGSANAQATNAMVPASISQTGQVQGRSGNCRFSLFTLATKTMPQSLSAEPLQCSNDLR